MTSNYQIQLPPSKATVEVSIIDTTARFRSVPLQIFGGPRVKGFEVFDCVTYAFLVTHRDATTGKERKVVFDLGPPKNWQEDLAPSFVERIRSWGAEIQIDKHVSEILEDNGMPLADIEAIIWSHPHWDHVGRPSLFPSSTTLITGPGVKDAFLPGFPGKAESPILSREFEGREIRELDFSGSSNAKIGSFNAIDFFGDGSFYLLEAPGHCVGHVNGLARTTADPNTSFILMGADSFHHVSQLRPSRHLKLPDSITIPDFNPSPCPGGLLESLHPGHPSNQAKIPSRYQSHFQKEDNSDPKRSPFLTISVAPDGSSVAVDINAARQTINGLQEFDGDERVLIVAAHDTSLLDVLDYFPAPANDWKLKGWKQSGQWKFLEHFKRALDVANKL